MSSANDKNVVKPPQNPVMSKTFSPGVITWAFSNSPKNSPMMKQPMMLTRKVPHRKRSVEHAGTPFADQITATGAYKTSGTGDEHCFDHS